jgi:CRP-like cAMP-binding protein
MSEELVDVDSLVRELQRCSLFAELAAEDVTRIAPFVSERRVPAGTVIVREGERASELFIIRDGSVEVTKRAPGASHDHRLTTLAPGATFGEISIVDGGPRSATVRALTAATLGVLDFDRLNGANGLHDGVRSRVLGNVSAHLGRRLRDVSEVTVVALENELDLARTRVAMGNFLVYLIFIMIGYAFVMRLVTDMARAAADSTLVTIPVVFGFAVPLFIMVRQSGQPMATYGLTWRGAGRAAVDAVVWTTPVLALCVGFKAVLVGTVPHLARTPIFSFGGFLDPAATSHAAWFTLGMSLVYVGVVVPVQEFIARGALQGPLQRFLVGPHATVLAIVIANGLFTASHLYLSTTFALIAMVPGFLWGWLYARNQTLVAPIVSHALVGWWGLFVLGLDRVLA